MDFLVYNEKEIEKSVPFFSSVGINSFKDCIKKAVEEINIVKKAVLDKDYEKYFILTQVFPREVSFGGEYVDIFEATKRLSKKIPIIDKIEHEYHWLNNRITDMVNREEDSLGELSRIFIDIEEALKYDNFYDLFFLLFRSEKLIDKLGKNTFGKQVLKVEKSTRDRLYRKIRDYRNKVISENPKVVDLWEIIRYHESIEHALDNISNAVGNLVSVDDIENLKDEFKKVGLLMGVGISEMQFRLDAIKNDQNLNTALNLVNSVRSRRILRNTDK